MVDTMTIYHKFKSYDEYKTAMGIMNEYIKQINPMQPLHGMSKRSNALAHCGFEEVRFTQNISFVMYIKFRPKLMTEPGNYTNVLREYDLPYLYKKFTHFMNKIGLYVLSDLRKWKVKRIDYAVDIIVPLKQIPTYIELFHKGNIKESLLNTETSQKYKDAENNLYLGSTSYRINFYDRYTTALEKRFKHPERYKNISDRHDTLRFEVQLINIEENNSVKKLLNIENAKKYILRNYEEIIGKGDYYSYHKALQKCRSGLQVQILKLIHDTGSVHAAKQVYISNGDRRKRSKKFSEIINKLEKLSINPVTIESGTLKNLYSKVSFDLECSNKFLISRRKTYNEE